jgi:hypothetical protein
MKRSPRVTVLDSGIPMQKQDRKHVVGSPPIFEAPGCLPVHAAEEHRFYVTMGRYL